MADDALISWAKEKQWEMLLNRGANGALQSVPARAEAIVNVVWDGRVKLDEITALSTIRCASWWFLGTVGALKASAGSDNALDIELADHWIPLEGAGIATDLAALTQLHLGEFRRLSRLQKAAGVARVIGLCEPFRSESVFSVLSFLDAVLAVACDGRRAEVTEDGRTEWFAWSQTVLPLMAAQIAADVPTLA
jgi:hypothetical protein